MTVLCGGRGGDAAARRAEDEEREREKGPGAVTNPNPNRAAVRCRPSYFEPSAFFRDLRAALAAASLCSINNIRVQASGTPLHHHDPLTRRDLLVPRTLGISHRSPSGAVVG